MDKELSDMLDKMSSKPPYTRKVLDNNNGDIHDPRNFESDADYMARILREQKEMESKG